VTDGAQPHARNASPAPVAALLTGRPVATAAVVLAGSWLLAASSWADIPMYPVPMTLQTLMVCVVAGLCGAVVGGVMVVVWLVQAMAGLPVLAGGESGIEAFGGATAGYLGGFVLAAGVCGRLAENPMMRGWLAMTGLFVFAHVLVLAMGWARLQLMTGTTAAWEGGVEPFLIGAVVKSVLAVVMVKLIERALPKQWPA
jgi:biotin transport system substrate-specific component